MSRCLKGLAMALTVAAAACMWFREGIVQPAPINQVRVGPVPAVPQKISRLYKNESVLKLVSHYPIQVTKVA